jgi:hypothetical protein
VKSARIQLPSANDGIPPGDPSPELQAPWAPLRLRGGTWERADGSVDSVQWVDLPGVETLNLVALEPFYFQWVPRLSAGFVRPRTVEGVTLSVEPLEFPTLIRLAPAAKTETTLTRNILGGLLAPAGGSIGFAQHVLPEGCRLVVAVRALKPRLPRWLYFRVQAQLHERSTFGFLRQVAAATRRASAA